MSHHSVDPSFFVSHHSEDWVSYFDNAQRFVDTLLEGLKMLDASIEMLKLKKHGIVIFSLDVILFQKAQQISKHLKSSR